MDCNKLDKRTKAYKECIKQQNEIKGLGDVVEKITEVTGIKKVVEVFTGGKDCGCAKRKEKLNKMFPVRKKPVRCLTEQQYLHYKEYRSTRTLNVWNESEIHFLVKLYAHVFAIQYKANDFCRNCQGSAKLLLEISKSLDKVFETYEKDMQDLKMS